MNQDEQYAEIREAARDVGYRPAPSASRTAMHLIQLAWQSVLFSLGLGIALTMIASCWPPSAQALAGWLERTLIPFLHELALAIAG